MLTESLILFVLVVMMCYFTLRSGSRGIEIGRAHV